MRNKAKYNFNNAMILICSIGNDINEETKEKMMDYVDKLFVEYSAPDCKYKLYTSVLTKEEAMKKFPKQFCWECGTVSNIFFPKFEDNCGMISKTITCEICCSFYKGFNTDNKNFISTIRYIKYNHKRKKINRYKKFIRKNRY